MNFVYFINTFPQQNFAPYSAPYININDENVTTSTNQPTTLYITAGGFLLPDVEWSKDN